MLLIVLVSLGILALLSVLYVAARQHPLFGDALAFVCVLVARPFVRLQAGLEKVGLYCTNVFEKSLRYPPNVAHDTWHGVLVIARNFILMVSIIILTGDIYNTLQSVPLLFGGSGAVSLPGIFSIPTSLLFVAMCMLFGSILLECIESIPFGAGLFPKLSEKVRKLLIVVSSCGVVLSLIFAVLFWVYRGTYLADPESAGVLAIPVFALVGLLVSLASVFALWGLVVGLTGLASIVSWLLSMVFNLAAHGVSFIPSMLDVLALHFTTGIMSVYGDFIGHDPYKAPSSPFPLSRQLLPGQNNTTIAVLPQNASTIVDADNIVTLTQNGMENVPMNPDKNAAVLFIGSGFPYQMYTHVANETVVLDAAKATLSSAVIDPSVNHMQTGIPGVVDMSPPFAKRHAVASHVNTRAETIKKLADDLADTVAQTHQNLKAIPAPVILFSGCYDLIECVDMLESTKRRYPMCKIVVVTEASSLDLQDKIVQVGISDVRALIAEDIVEVLIVTDPNSPVVREHGLHIQHQYIAKLIVSLVVAATHSDTNVSFADALSALHTCAEVVVINARSKGVAIGRVPNRFALVPGVKGRIGDGSLPDLLRQCQAAIDDVLTNDETAMYPLTPADRGSFRVVILDVPIDLSDPRFSVICRENALYVQTNYPNTLCLTVKGNGVAPLHHIGSPFLVQASCLTPILDPTLIFRAAAPPSTKVTQLRPVTPDTLSTNGNVPALPINSTNAVKAPTSSRQKKPASRSRRVIRKNTKQA